MSEQFDASRPIYAQLVERLKARILAGTYPPGGHLDSVRTRPSLSSWARALCIVLGLTPAAAARSRTESRWPPGG